jgi:hypothetical protein
VRRLLATLALVGALVALAGCGSGDSDKVEVGLYVSNVCTSLRSWREQLEQASAVLAQRTSTMDDLSAVRRQFVQFFAGAIGVTDEMIAAVEDAGVPDLENGEAIAAGLQGEVRKFRPILVDARTAARRLPVDDEVGFATQAQRLGTRFQIEANGLATMFQALDERYDAAELLRAADADATCSSL